MKKYEFRVVAVSDRDARAGQENDEEIFTQAMVTVEINNPALKASDIASGLCDGFSSMLESLYDGVDGWSTDVEVKTIQKKRLIKVSKRGK